MDKGLVLVGPWPPPRGGVSTHIYRSIAYLNSHNKAVGLVSTTVLPEAEGLTFKALVNKKSLTSWIKALWHTRGCRLVMHGSHGKAVCLAALATVFRSDVTVYVHNPRWLASAAGSSASRWLLGLAVRLGVKFICVSSECAHLLSVANPDARFDVLPAFLPPMACELRRSARPASLKGEVIIGWCGRISDRVYGFDRLVGCLSALVAGGVDGHALVAAPDADESSIHNICRKYGLEGRLTLVPSSESFAAWLDCIDVFLRPTRTDGDAISVREAIWRRVPVVASDVAKRPKQCRLFEAEADATEIAAAVLSIKRAGAPNNGEPAEFNSDTEDDAFSTYIGLLRCSLLAVKERSEKTA